MAATASSAPNSSSHSPPYSLNSSMSRSRRVPSPWTQIVRGSDTHLIHDDSAPSMAPAIFAGDASLPPTDNDIAGKKPAWNNPSCSSAEVGPVMGAHSWPALTVSARLPSNKSSSSESLKGLSDSSSPSSIPASLGAGTPFSTQEQTIGNANAYPNPNASTTFSDNQNVPVLKRPYRRNNTDSSTSSYIADPLPPHNAAAVPLNTLSSRDQNHNQRSGSRGGGNPSFRNSNRNRNGGSYPRGAGIQHQNYGGRRNYDHGNQTGFPHWKFTGRDVHMQPLRGLGLMRTQVPSAPQIIAAPDLRPFGGPMMYPEYASAIYMPHLPPVSMALIGQLPPQPMYYPGHDPMLFSKIVKQVDFYFSADNLSKDNYLRQHMDDEGWVPISLIAGFRRLAELTNNIQVIMDAVGKSAVVEVEGESIRRRGDWSKYVWPRELRDPSVWRRQGVGVANKDTMEAQFQNMTLSDRQDAEGESIDAAQERCATSGM